MTSKIFSGSQFHPTRIQYQQKSLITTGTLISTKQFSESALEDKWPHHT